MKNRIYGLATGLIVIALTVFVYLMTVENIFKVPMNWVCLCAILLSEIATFGIYLFLKSDLKRMSIAAVYAVQTVLTIVLSIIFINVFVFAFTTFIIIYIVTLAVATVIAIFMLGLQNGAEKKNEAFMNAKISMLSIRAVVNEMLNSENGKEYKALLGKLDENLRFTDDSVTDEMDASIYERVNELSANIGNTDFDVEKAVEGINGLIKQRNFIVKNKKSYR